MSVAGWRGASRAHFAIHCVATSGRQLLPLVADDCRRLPSLDDRGLIYDLGCCISPCLFYFLSSPELAPSVSFRSPPCFPLGFDLFAHRDAAFQEEAHATVTALMADPTALVHSRIGS